MFIVIGLKFQARKGKMKYNKNLLWFISGTISNLNSAQFKKLEKQDIQDNTKSEI